MLMEALGQLSEPRCLKDTLETLPIKQSQPAGRQHNARAILFNGRQQDVDCALREQLYPKVLRARCNNDVIATVRGVKT